ncbi:c6 zinc finger [Fusarium beomiforme]|uniref:C6 zinc finger n=1 Tax=Fusarium beomiforme TaxID=44412 RepID=A0A9P5E7F4_9HYPO|nr:c6 zinc finger [Fusarium beomiforme]
MSPPASDQQEMTAEPDRRQGKRPAPRGTAFYPRKRANTACQVCRARKTKCDNQKPSCSYCVSVGATCIQSPVDLSAFDPASLKILERLDELEKLIREPRNESQSQSQSQSHGAIDDGQTNGNGHELLPVEESPTQSLQLSPEGTSDISLRSILPEKMESLLLWSVLSRDMSSHTTLQPDPPQPSPSFSPGCTSLADIADLDTQGVKALLDNFFDHVHCKNPILEEAAARKIVLNVVIDGIDWSPGSCLTLIICALGKIATPLDASFHLRCDSTPYLEAQALFQAAQKRIGTLMARSDIIGAQCFFLSGVFLMSTFRPFEAWRYFSQALAMCQTLPFLQSAQSLSIMEGSRPELGETQQEAVYWSAWKSERELRGELSLPDFSMPYSSSVLYPPFFPTPPHPLESTKTIASSRQHTAWLFYLSEISLRRLSSRTCNDILELHRASTSNMDFLKQLALMIPAYETQANEWADSLPPELSIASSPIEDNVCCFVLRGHLVNFFERLYWPFVMAHLAALERGVTTPIPGRQFVDKGLEYHVLRVDINEAGFLHRHHGTWLMIRALVRSATVLLAARLLGSAMPRGWREACERIMQVLRAWEDDVPGLSNHRNFLEEVLHGLAVSGC